MPILLVSSGSLAGQPIEVTRELVLGREGADVLIDDPEVSRRHVVVRPRDGGLEVEDLGSRNGTRVDGVKIGAPVLLSRDGQIHIGGTEIAVQIPMVGGETRAAAQPMSAETVVRPAVEATPQPPTREAAPAPATGHVAPAPAAAPDRPFGSYMPPSTRRRRGVATRRVGPMVLVFAIVAADAAALIVYFASR